MRLAGILDDYRQSNGDLPAYAWPGGYAVAYLADDGEFICAKCVNDPTNPVHVAREDDSRDGWRIEGYMTTDNKEEDDDWTCSNCYVSII
jgi:hypothetical protein